MSVSRQAASSAPVVGSQADPRRARVINCAFDRFSTLGYGQTGMSQIATDARVSTAWMYREFGGKRELFDAVFDDKVGHFVEVIDPGGDFGDQASTKDEFIGLLPELAVRAMSALETDPRLFTGLLANAASTDTEMRYRILGLESLVAHQVAAVVDEAVERGWFTGDSLTSTVLGHAIIALGLPGAIMLIDGDMTDREFLFTAGIEMSRDGLLGSFDDDDIAVAVKALEDYRSPPMFVGATDRRSQLMDAALSCYLQHGYFAVTPTLIAQTVGVAYSTFYTYFENRRDCLWGVVDREMTRLIAACALHRPIPRSREEFIGRLTELLETIRRYTETNPELTAFLALGVVGIDSSAAARMTQSFLRICELASDFVRRCADAGFLREGLDPEAAGPTVVSVVCAAAAAQIDVVNLEQAGQIVLPLVAMLCGGAEGVDVQVPE